MLHLDIALQKLGLSVHESQIYMALLSLGESSVGPLIEKTGLHREIVYGVLKRLEQQALIQSLQKKRIRHYQALPPDRLTRRVQKIAKLAEKIVPDLQQLYRRPDVLVQVFEGPDGFEELQKDIAASLNDREEYFVIGGAGKAWYDVTRDFYKVYHRRLFKRGIRMKTVTFANEVEGIVDNELPGFNPLRVLPDTFRVPSSTMIYADKILLQIFGEQPIGVLIQSRAVAMAYKQYFQTLWQLAEEPTSSHTKRSRKTTRNLVK